MSLYSCNREVYEATSSREHAVPRENYSIFLGSIKIFTLVVGEIFDMFPSSNTSGDGIVFLNQLTFLDGNKHLDSMAQISWVGVLLGINTFPGRKMIDGAWRHMDIQVSWSFQFFVSIFLAMVYQITPP